MTNMKCFNYDSSSSISNISRIAEFNVKSLKFHFLKNNINGNDILLVTTHFNFKKAYLSTAAFIIVPYILIHIIWKNVYNSQMKLENTGLSKGKLLSQKLPIECY